MTTIVATREGVWADSQCTSADPCKTSKLRRLEHTNEQGEVERYVAAGCGFLDEINYIMELIQRYGLKNLWTLHDGEHWPPKILKTADSDVLVVTEKGEIWMVPHTMVPWRVEQPWYATGSGGNYATSHMQLMKKGPKAAIMYAATICPYTKGPVRHLPILPIAKKKK